jgi:competence protein ComEA
MEYTERSRRGSFGGEMKLTRDEAKALALIALLLVLAAGARLLGRAEPLDTDAAALDLEALESASRALLASAERRRQPLTLGERLDPNMEDADELARLPGIGRALAERIVDEREAGGPFNALGDLTRVAGIGPATLERLGPFLDLPGRSPPSPQPARSTSSIAPGPGLSPDRSRGGETERERLHVDPNRATVDELERLPGIGPVIAERIVAFRDSVGPFQESADLEQVPGIGPATTARLASYLRLP